jgi:ATP-binding cassette subfamily D (ALD) protein 3
MNQRQCQCVYVCLVVSCIAINDRPNGVGKSSLFRVIGNLWPLHNGVLTKPHNADVLFVPQKPYLVLGTLRDQVIYPHSHTDMKRLGVTDEDLAHLLAIVDPAQYILTEWKLDTVKDWFHAFSGGQKQRVAMARLFYHRPRFAILDECTSAVSDEVEDVIYTTCRKLGITIFTVSHRPNLARHHDIVLRFEGINGAYSIKKVTDSEKQQAQRALERIKASTSSNPPTTTTPSTQQQNGIGSKQRAN